MDRRTIIKQISLMTGVAFIGGELFIQSGCKTEKKAETPSIFSAEQVLLLDDVGETILPQTDTPGAKAIGIGAFIKKMVTDCYNPDQQKIFIGGLDAINADFEKKFSIPFSEGSTSQREECLNQLNATMMQYKKDKEAEDPDHFFLMMKQMTILGYFTSEAGATQTLRYMAVPGKYDGSYSYKKGDKAWAT